MKKNKTGWILAIVGAVVVVCAITYAMIHFWEDIKNLLPGGKKDEEDFEDFEAREG